MLTDVQEIANAARAINGMLAPAIMISASALIILALQTKYSQLIDRLRGLNEERRGLAMVQDNPSSVERQSDVVEQIRLILVRAKLVRNSIISYYVAILLFVLSSITIGTRLTLNVEIPISPSLVIFMLGMVSVVAGTVYALRDIARAYTIAQVEARGVETADGCIF